MQFLLMCCFNEKDWAALPESRRNQIMDEYGKFIDSLKKKGQLLAGAKLDNCAHAVSVRHENGKPAVVDGPFAETKEQLGGYHLVECANREEAVALAMRIPTLPAGGKVEVRPVLFLE
jgi:hypothetical protein